MDDQKPADKEGKKRNLLLNLHSKPSFTWSTSLISPLHHAVKNPRARLPTLDMDGSSYTSDAGLILKDTI